MIDAIILLIVLVIMIFAVKGTIKHFKWEGPCCGGGSGSLTVKEDKKLTNPKIGEKIIQIEGMHCEHCCDNVTAALNRLNGVSAKVNLKKKCAVVSYDRAVDDGVLKRAVESAGYTVVSIH